MAVIDLREEETIYAGNRFMVYAMYPETEIIGGSEKIVVYDSPEGRKIREMLVRYNGSREKVAAALGISTTTLWRHMKKYGIEANYR